MSDALKSWARKAPKSDERPVRPGLSLEERRALLTLRREARAADSYLASGGKGGLSPSLVLSVLRRDGYTCKACGERGDPAANGGIVVHHKGGVLASRWLRAKGHKNDRNNIVTLCVRCHDRIHDQARADGEDASQVEREESDHGPGRDAPAGPG